MNPFYVSIIFMGIMLMAFAMVWVAYDKKKSHDNVTLWEDKKDDLENVVKDAEQMLEELNKFSDYILSRIEEKNQEVTATLRTIEEKLEKLESAVPVHAVEVAIPVVQEAQKEEKIKRNDEKEKAVAVPDIQLSYNSDLIIDALEFDNSVYERTQASKLQGRVKDKVIPINSRHREVMQLAERGMSETDIAKKLNMGKGEIELIIGMSK